MHTCIGILTCYRFSIYPAMFKFNKHAQQLYIEFSAYLYEILFIKSFKNPDMFYAGAHLDLRIVKY